MRVFVTGATGFIGSAIVGELLRNGHQVLGLVRSEANAATLQATGAEVHRGALDDLGSLHAGAASCEAVVHTAFNHDFVNTGREVAAAEDRRAIETIGDALAGTGRPFIMCTGSGFASGKTRTEVDAGAPSPRQASEQAALALAARGVRSMVMGLPPTVHGAGDHGFIHTLVEMAKAKGASAYVGDGRNRWPAVHRLDAAVLFRLGLEKGAAGSRLHAIDDEGIATRQIAEVIGRHLKLPVVSKQAGAEVMEHFGWLGHFFAMDLPASSLITREALGWAPTQPGLLADLAQGHYF